MKEFKSEADLRNFRNKLLLLPKKLLFQVNLMIEDGKKEWAIEGFLKREYKGTLGVPTPPTIASYIDWYLAKKQIQQAKGIVDVPTATEMAILEKQEIDIIDDERQAILDKTTPIEDKKKLLELLIKKCIQRVRKVESLQDVEGMTSSLEAVIGSYLREIHSITTTQLKLSGELQAEQNEIIGQMINRNMYQLITLVFQVIASVVPEKADDLKNKIFEKLKESKELADVLGAPTEPKAE